MQENKFRNAETQRYQRRVNHYKKSFSINCPVQKSHNPHYLLDDYLHNFRKQHKLQKN